MTEVILSLDTSVKVFSREVAWHEFSSSSEQTADDAHLVQSFEPVSMKSNSNEGNLSILIQKTDLRAMLFSIEEYCFFKFGSLRLDRDVRRVE